MISKFKQFLEEKISNKSVKESDSVEKQLQIATAALFVEMSLADFESAPEEEASIRAALTEAYALTGEELEEVMSLASEKMEASSCLYEFTRLINQHYEPQQKYHVVKLLWRVAYADGRLDKYEEQLIRKVADLIFVPHKEMMKAKHQEKKD